MLHLFWIILSEFKCKMKNSIETDTNFTNSRWNEMSICEIFHFTKQNSTYFSSKPVTLLPTLGTLWAPNSPWVAPSDFCSTPAQLGLCCVSKTRAQNEKIYICMRGYILYEHTNSHAHTHTPTYIYFISAPGQTAMDFSVCLSPPSLSGAGWADLPLAGWLAGGSALFCWYCCVVVGVVGVLEPGRRWAEGKKVWKYNIWEPRAIQSPQDISTYKMLAHTLKQTHIRTHTRSTRVQQVHVIVTERSLSIEVVLELNARWMSCGIN